MSVQIDVYFRVYCNVCSSELSATYSERNQELSVEPCECCLQQKIEETEERVKNDRSKN